MSERYPLPTKDIKLGVRILSKIMKSTYKEVRPIAEPVVIKDQLRKMLHKE